MALKIVILGADCSKCCKLYDRVQKIVHDNGLVASIEKITDTYKIIAYGIYSVPALVINNKVVSKGAVPSETEIIKFVNDFLPENEKLPVPLKKKLNKSILLLGLPAVIIVTVVFAFLFSNQNNKSIQSKIQLSNTYSKPLNIADSINILYNYKLQSNTYKMTFLEFGSKGCIECKKMEKVMDEVKLKYKNSVNVVFYNVRNKENKKIVEYFGIQMIPVQVLLDSNGKECFRHIGYYSFNELSIQFKKNEALY